MYFKKRLQSSLASREQLISPRQKFHISLIHFMTIIYIFKALIDALVDPAIYYALEDQ